MSSTSERQMIELLAERAKLLADGAQFDHALHDAATIRALAPASSVGYLLAGDVYQMQGRQRAAVSMYEDGLASVPENEDGYTHLSNRRTDALHADAKHVDFISQLFLDNVVNVIFPIILDSELSTETPCPYLYVCRAWRRRILENYGLRFQVTVSIIQGQHDQLVKFADHVKSLAIIDFYESANDFYADILKKAHFPKLNILTIRGYGIHDIRLFRHTLSLVGATLTHLNIDMLVNTTVADPISAFAQDVITLPFLLLYCPNLISLTIRGVNVGGWGLLSTPHPKLTKLDLFDRKSWNIMDETQANSSAIEYDAMTSLLMHLPSLVSLTLGLSGTQLLPVIHKYCPKLRVLTLGDRKITHEPSPNPCQRGLQLLAVGQLEMSYPLDDVVGLINQHCATLERIKISDYGYWQSSPKQKKNHVHKLERLDYLQMTGGTDDMLLLAERIIQAAPNLREIDIAYDGVQHDGLVHAIMGLKHLESLSIDVNALSSKWFYDVVMHHAASLTNIQLTLYYANEGHQMPSFAFLKNLPRLRSLVLTMTPLDIARDIIEPTHDIASSCLGLESFSLGHTVGSIPTGSIAAFKKHQRLTELRIIASSEDDNELVNVLCIPNLKHLVLYMPVKDSTLEILRNKIPHVEYKPLKDLLVMTYLKN